MIERRPTFTARKLPRPISGNAPADVEKGVAALLAFEPLGSGADSTKGKQRHDEK
jgi:hypothetical protein